MNEQLSLFPVASDTKLLSLADNAIDAKRKAISRFLNGSRDEPIAHVNTYSPGSRDAKYYRLSYRLDKSMKHFHIKGGNTNARLAKYRAEKLQSMIDRGAELTEVLEQLADFNGGVN